MFVGTPAFAIPSLDAIVASGNEIPAVFTMPPRPAGRGRLETRTAVHDHAEGLGIDVLTHVPMGDDEGLRKLRSLEPDLVVVAAYGAILPQTVLDVPRLGFVNVHASLLPRWRGAAPVQRAILAGDERSGITLIRMDRGMDTGPILAMEALMIGDRNAGSLTTDLAILGGRMISRALPGIGTMAAVPQPAHGATRADKTSTAQARLDFTSDAVQIGRCVRAFNPWPGAWTTMMGGRLRVLEAECVDAAPDAPGVTIDGRLTISCGRGAIRPTVVQREGRKPVSVAQLLQSMRIPVGTRLG